MFQEPLRNVPDDSGESRAQPRWEESQSAHTRGCCDVVRTGFRHSNKESATTSSHETSPRRRRGGPAPDAITWRRVVYS
uniref:Uncharacterized protein n=1 Tax=Angiostrongylus cantonensis TaxID=6313 RepID=A0A0K0CXG2_ANGCA